MQLVRLGPAYSSSYIPDIPIEGYISLIWTERHSDLGEFELKTYDVERISALLPEDTLISHLETRYVMKVDTLSIQDEGEGVDRVPVLTVTGKSAEEILNHRWVESSYQQRRRMRRVYSATSAACVLVYNAVVNKSGKDVTRGDSTAATPDVNDYNWTIADAIPNAVVVENVSAEGANRWWMLTQGMLLPQLQAIIKAQDLGIRCLRPVLPNNVTVVTVDSALSTRGTVRRTPTANVGALQFQIYDGVDRSADVKFSMLQGHVVSPEYLTSNADNKSVVEIMSGVVEVLDAYRPGESGLSGWQRKTVELDAGSAEKPVMPTRPDPPKSTASAGTKANYNKAYDQWIDDYAVYRNKLATWVSDFREEATAKAQDVLKQTRKVNVFSGDVSDTVPYKYKTNYDLGDYVTVVGDYGKTAVMVVHEYVRTEDENGDRGFPGLVAL